MPFMFFSRLPKRPLVSVGASARLPTALASGPSLIEMIWLAIVSVFISLSSRRASIFCFSVAAGSTVVVVPSAFFFSAPGIAACAWILSKMALEASCSPTLKGIFTSELTPPLIRELRALSASSEGSDLNPFLSCKLLILCVFFKESLIPADPTVGFVCDPGRGVGPPAVPLFGGLPEPGLDPPPLTPLPALPPLPPLTPLPPLPPLPPLTPLPPLPPLPPCPFPRYLPVALAPLAPLNSAAPTFSLLAVGYSTHPPLPELEPYTIFEWPAVCGPLPDVNGAELPGTVG